MLGAFTEDLINFTIKWYLNNNIVFFKKSYAPTVFYNSKSSYQKLNTFRAKGDIDYYGVYQGKYISFEVKETKKDFFLLNRIKQHQLDILFKLDDLKAISFLILNFTSYEDACYIITTSELKNWIQKNKKRIKYSDVESLSIGTRIPITSPGVVDFLKILGLRE